MRAVELLHAGEPRVVGVDGGGDRALPVPGGHGQRRHGHLVAHPDRGVAGEQQVGQRGDDEVPAVHHLVGQPVTAAQLVVGQAGDERAGQFLGVSPDRCVVAARCSVAPSRGSSTAAAISSARADGKTAPRPAAGPGAAPRHHGRPAPARTVVLLLRAVHPRDAVEEQLVVVAGREPPQLVPGPVQQDGAEPADLAGGAHERDVGRGRDHGQRLAQGAGPTARHLAGRPVRQRRCFISPPWAVSA